MPTKKQELESGPVTVGDLLGDQRRFQIPLYQRHYVWSEEQLTALWKDIDELLDGSAEIRFLGALVLQLHQASTAREAGRYYVIDGQQRITTMFLLLAAIAWIAQSEGYPDLTETIEKTYLLLTKKKSEHQPKISPAYPDRRQFNDVMKSLEYPPALLDPPHGTDAGKMRDAFLSLASEVEQRVNRIALEIEEGSRPAVEGSEDPYLHQALDYFLDLVLEMVEFIEITLDERHDPNEVFDRLNTAGQPLAVSDLVRNDVFRRLQDDPSAADQIYHHNWLEFEESFGKGEIGIELHNDYYWPFAVATNPATSRARMFKDLQRRCDGKVVGLSGTAPALEIIKDLEQYVPAYLAVAAGDRPDGVSESVWTSIRQLSAANLHTTSYPFFIVLVTANLNGDCSDDNVAKTCEIVESFMVRRALIGLEPTGLRAIFKDLWTKSKGVPKEVRKHITSRTIEFPSDETVLERSVEQEIYGGRIAKFVIGQYEKSLQATSPDPLTDLPEITIDHVMPQDRSGGWSSTVSAEDHERLQHTWGNLVPLSNKANSLKGNKGFSFAKELLEKETKFLSARAVLEETTWTASKIEERGRALAKWATKRWPNFESDS